MPVPIIAAAIGVAGAVGASAISSSAQRSAAENAEELAKQQQEEARTEQARLEEKYGLTQGELAREQRLLGIPEGQKEVAISEGLEERRGAELERRAGATGEELLKEVGPETAKLLDTIAARSGKTGEELLRAEGGISGALLDQILAETQQPGKFYEETLGNELELARTMVNAEANRRGVFSGLPEGGIRFENLGRAGVDLAIKSAEAKTVQRQQALSNAYQVLQRATAASTTARGEQAAVGTQALSESEKARAELDNFLQLMEGASSASKGRAAQVGVGASQAAGQQISSAYDTLTGLEGYKAGITSPVAAGLSTIGQVGADVAGSELETLLGTKKTTTAATPSSYEELLKASELSSPKKRLGDITGSNLMDEYSKYKS